MSGTPTTFLEFKQLVQDVFDGNERALEATGKNVEAQLKTYLVESTTALDKALAGFGSYRQFDVPGWYNLHSDRADGTLVLDASQARVWRLFSLVDAVTSDEIVETWIGRVPGLDHCWLSRQQMMQWSGQSGWSQRGVGLHFNDGLSQEEDSGNFSLKAWHGASKRIPGLDQVIEKAQESFAISSVRWQRRKHDETALVTECYSDGKITTNRSTDVDEALTFSSVMSSRYKESIDDASALRDQNLAPFEFQFSQPIDLEAFAQAVGRGRGPMRLWLAEVESEPDFRRFRGVDLHTWDRVLLDVGVDYAYLSIPHEGCVNAAPRIATIQGEDNSGRTNVFFDGVEVFA